MLPIRFPLLKGKTAIVTGGTTGIGRAIVFEYLRQGCNVAVNHLGSAQDDIHRVSLLKEAQQIRWESEERGDDALAGELIELAGDVTKPETGTTLVQKTVERFKKVDILVANAGIFRPASFLE